MFFLTEGSTHDKLVQMAPENYNLNMNTEVVELTYSLLETMMQQMASDAPHIHVTSDRQVWNLIAITKTHYVCFCVSSRSKFGNKEAKDSNEVSEEAEVEDSNEGEEYDDNLPQDGKDGREKDDDICWG
ncbi:hypothetical protein N665_0361s0004 [Sinapis alba]|nr:hypothetical protein N665_0361s0004 [Sinapis alba]